MGATIRFDTAPEFRVHDDKYPVLEVIGPGPLLSYFIEAKDVPALRAAIKHFERMDAAIAAAEGRKS